MDKKGFSSSELSANIELQENRLLVKNLKGNIAIQTNSNFYSTYQIVIFKENLSLSEKEISKKESLNENLIYENVIAKGGISVSKDNIKLDGFFEGSFDLEKYISIKEGNYGLDISNLNLEFPLNMQESLKENEQLAFAVYVDGGLDFSSVKVDPNFKSKTDYTEEETNTSINCYPNPASEFLNVELENKSTRYNIKLLNINGAVVDVKLTGNSNGVHLSLENIPNGIYFLKIIKDDETIETKKIVVNH